MFHFFKKISKGLVHGAVVFNVLGTPIAKTKDETKVTKLTEGVALETDHTLMVGEHEILKLKINNRYELTAFSSSVISLEGVYSKKDYDIESIYLQSGSFYLKSIKPNKEADKEVETETEVKAFKIKTDFYNIEFDSKYKLDFFADVIQEKPSMTVCNLGDEFKLSLFEHEIAQVLKTNESIGFQGQLDQGKIAHDILLEGRKAPKGKWLSKEKCSPDKIKRLQKEIENKYSKKMALQKAKDKAEAERKAEELASSVCHNPLGKLDQCHFVLSDSVCVRTRCNAEGKWSNREEINPRKHSCTKKGEVRSCGY